METLNLIGGAWLTGRYGLNLVTPLAVQSRIGGRRKTELVDWIQQEPSGQYARKAGFL
jgi:hypothetical protein